MKNVASRSAARSDGMDATRKLAQYAASISFDALPQEIIDLVKQCVLDTLGVTVGASGLAPEARIAFEYVRDLGGRQESSILGFGGKAPAALAAFVNGGMGHMLDYDDAGNGHVSIATIPVALALAEKRRCVSGKDFIAAIACGTDVMTRLDISIPIPEWTAAEGWFATQLFGYVAGAAAGGRVLGLSADEMENALGIAFNQMSGTRQMAEGASTHMRSMQAGFSGQGAALAAQLAGRGMTGDKEFLEGKYGLFKTYVRTNEPDWDALIGELGVRFPIFGTHAFKVWPACALTRAPNAAILELRTQHNLHAEDVEGIGIIGGHLNTQQLCEPIEKKRRPRIGVDGKFSIPFTAAVMMVKGNVTMRDYTDEGLSDPSVLAIADKISYRSLSEGAQRTPYPEIEIRTKDGRLLRSKVHTVPGDPNSPVDWKLLETKFRDCLSFSAKAVPDAKARHVIELVHRLDELDDVTEILNALV